MTRTSYLNPIHARFGASVAAFSTFALALFWLGSTWFAPLNKDAASARGLSGIANAAACLQWTSGNNAGVAGRTNSLVGAAAASRNDIWAVGYHRGSDDARTLIMHWDGKEWKIVPSPNPNPGQNYLEGVTVLSATNAWAVGYSDEAKSYHPIILHWDGSAWTSVAAPALLNETSAELVSISATSANDIWAVGDYGDPTHIGGAIIHWDGNIWGVSKTVNLGKYSGSFISSVAVRAPNDVWAIGAQGTENGVRDLQLRWNGSEWLTVSDTASNRSRFNRYTYDIAFASGSEAHWVVGVQSNQPYILHFDGRKNDETGGELRVLDYNALYAVASTGPSEAWAVGNSRTSGDKEVLPFIVHTTNGSNWSGEAGVPVEGQGTLNDIVAVPNSSGELVAVGTANGGALMEMLLDKCAAPPPTASALPSSPPATPTSQVSTALPTYGPTPIPGESQKSRTFSETGKTARGIFLDYWDNNGALTQQGFPISEMFTEVSPLNGKPYTVQYFERAVFEYHPENQAPYNLLLSQLGTFQYKQKYPGGAPGQQPNSTEGSMLVSETGKHLGGKFLEYWKTHGGVAQQGYPISNEFVEKSDTNGKEYLVQYFERAVLEYHPENQAPYDVLLSQLGTFQYKQKYGGK